MILLIGVCAILGWRVWKLKKKICVYQAIEKRLGYLSQYDLLSGLQNRNAFMCSMKKREAFCVTVAACDIDGLKIVNDNLGHWAGDRLIRSTADILKKVCPTGTQLFRMGGDEFLAILPGVEETGKLQHALAEQVKLHNETDDDVPLSLSVGITTADNEDVLLEETIRKADYLMYEQKRRGQTYVLTWMKKRCGSALILNRRTYKNERRWKNWKMH